MEYSHLIYISVGFIGGWISRSFLVVFFNEPYRKNNINRAFKKLRKEKRNLLKIIKTQDEIISSTKSSSNKTPFCELKNDINTKTQEELATIFEEENRRNSKTPQEKLDMGREIGEEPVCYFTNTNGGYVTLNEVQKATNKSSMFKKDGKLKRADELDIIHTFNNIRGMKYYDASLIVEKEGYSLYPIYINRGTKNPRSTYCGTVVGVSIEDSFFNFYENKPSKDAIITSIVDIGGQDSEDRENPSKKMQS